MLTEFILIAVALLFIVLLISIRYFGLAYAKDNSGNFFAKTDLKITKVSHFLKKLYVNTSRDLTELIKDLPHITLHIINQIFYKLYKKTKKLVDLIKGHRIKTDKGSVSIYLKRIESGSDKPAM